MAYHQAVLDALDGLLIPTTSNADLKQLLENVRPAIAAHLEHARRLSGSLVAAKSKGLVLAGVVLAGVAAWPGPDPVPPRRHVVEIRGMAFHPAVLEIHRGDTVVWVNRDFVPHTATGTPGARLGHRPPASGPERPVRAAAERRGPVLL